MSTHVHREGARKITVQDDEGRQLALVSENHELLVVAPDGGPHLTPQTARELAEELNQWANCQQTTRNHGQPRR